jgi:aminoglycoside 3-N-acetyltransferase
MPKPLASGPLCTHFSLAADFRSLGINPGTILLVHSSLKKLGFVCGGAEAVIFALLDVLGPDGTLVVPSCTGENSDPAFWTNPPVPPEWWPAIRASYPAYDPRTTRIRRAIGVVPETVRTWPGAVRSAHPQTSFAAIGPQAHAILDGHALDCMLGERSPLARLEESGAKVLLLGVGWSVCTAFHLAEYRGKNPPMEENAFAVMTEKGREWMTVQEVSTSGEKFGEMGESFESKGSVVRGKVGGADVRMFSLADAVRYAESWLPVHRPSKTD